VNIDAAGVQVAQDAPWKNLKDLLDYVKANPGKAKASGTGGRNLGSRPRRHAEDGRHSREAMPWVPSTGAATGLQELVAGGVQVVTASLVEGRSLIDAKKVRALATWRRCATRSSRTSRR